VLFEQVLADYPYLEREDVLQALRYAAWRAEEARRRTAERRPDLLPPAENDKP